MHQALLVFLLTLPYHARFSRDKLGSGEDSANYEGKKIIFNYMLSWQLRDINDFLLLYRLHKTIWIFHAARGNQPAWWLYSASHPSGTQLWTTTVLLIRMVLCPGWDLWKLFSSTSFPALFHTPSRITLNTTNVSLVYHEMRRLSSST